MAIIGHRDTPERSDTMTTFNQIDARTYIIAADRAA